MHFYFQVLDDTLNLLSNDFVTKRIEVTKEYLRENTVSCADPNQLKQAFLNILLNSIEAMKNGGKLTISTRPMAGKIFIKISDTGSGISKKIYRIFLIPSILPKTPEPVLVYL